MSYRCRDRYPHEPHQWLMWEGSPAERSEACPGVKDDGGCYAVLHHGPGHQSTTRCELLANHLGVHCTHYGGLDQRAYWSSTEGMTGFFDEAPDDDE